MESDVVIDGRDQIGHAGEHPAAQPLVGDVTEESLDHVKPGCGGGGKVHDEARMLGQPRLHDGVLVSGVVVADEVQRLALGRFAVDLLEEAQPLGVAMAVLALGNDFSVEYIECGEQVVVPLRL